MFFSRKRKWCFLSSAEFSQRNPKQLKVYHDGKKKNERELQIYYAYLTFYARCPSRLKRSSIHYLQGQKVSELHFDKCYPNVCFNFSITDMIIVLNNNPELTNSSSNLLYQSYRIGRVALIFSGNIERQQ